jgi:cobalamin biosynthesis protein CobT
MLTQGIEVMKYVRASAGRAGISVVFEDVNQPRHDGRTIYLPRITYKTTDMELKQLMASVDHEVAHDKFSCFDVLKEKKANPKGLLMFVWNFLEDSRINMIEAKEYLGFKENWDDCSSILVQDILSKSKKEKTTMSVLVEALIYWEARLSAHAFPQIELAASRVTPNKKILDVLSNYCDRLIDCHAIIDKRLGTEATFKLAEDILNELDEKCKEELPKPKLSPEGDEGDEDGKGAKASSKSGKAGESEDSEGERRHGKDDSDYKIIEVVVTEEDLNKYSVTIPEESGMSKVGINFKPVKSETGDWDLTDFNKFVVVNYPKAVGDAKYQLVSTANHINHEFSRRVTPKLVSQENFAQQVRRLIQIRAKVQRVYGVKKGKLDQSRLSRICFNAPGFNERVFKNKIENKTLDAAITVLVDKSGSMSGEKDLFAMASTLLVNEVCTTLNIPLEILGFTDDEIRTAVGREIAPVMYIYKNFSDIKVSDEDLRKYYGMSSSYMHGNPDAENILWAYDRLVKRKEKKKLLIVMSDGSPAASKGGSGIGRYTENVIKEIEASKNVEIYGLGLCSDSVEHYYKAHSVVNEPQDIPSKLIELIERKILR